MASLWLAEKPLLLASASAARRALIEAAQLPVETETSGLDERAIEAAMGPGASPAAIAARLAHDKAEAVGGRHPDRVVIGADQVLDLDGRTMAKPHDRADAGRQLVSLSGRAHRLHAAVAIAAKGRTEPVCTVSATLTMRELDEDAVARYLDLAGEGVCACAGGYQVEGIGIHLFVSIVGDHTAILGLPMLPLLAALRERGLIAL